MNDPKGESFFNGNSIFNKDITIKRNLNCIGNINTFSDFLVNNNFNCLGNTNIKENLFYSLINEVLQLNKIIIINSLKDINTFKIDLVDLKSRLNSFIKIQMVIHSNGNSFKWDFRNILTPFCMCIALILLHGTTESMCCAILKEPITMKRSRMYYTLYQK